MPKDYKNIKSGKKKSARNSKYLKSFFAGLTVGLCVAIIVYFYQHDVTQQTQIIQPQVTVAKPASELSQNDDTPPPTFDFYQILPNMEVNVSEWEAEDDGDIEEQADLGTENIGIYILQIGSFKRFDAADEVKAKLAFMGISAEIQRVVINGHASSAEVNTVKSISRSFVLLSSNFFIDGLLSTPITVGLVLPIGLAFNPLQAIIRIHSDHDLKKSLTD